MMSGAPGLMFASLSSQSPSFIEYPSPSRSPYCKALYAFILPPVNTLPFKELLASTPFNMAFFISRLVKDGSYAFINPASPDT